MYLCPHHASHLKPFIHNVDCNNNILLLKFATRYLRYVPYPSVCAKELLVKADLIPLPPNHPCSVKHRHFVVTGTALHCTLISLHITNVNVNVRKVSAIWNCIFHSSRHGPTHKVEISCRTRGSFRTEWLLYMSELIHQILSCRPEHFLYPPHSSHWTFTIR